MSSPEVGPSVSRRFGRRARLIVGVALVMLLFAGLAAGLLPRLVLFAAIDKCLDAGGAFDYTQSACQAEPKLPAGSASFGDAQPRLPSDLPSAGR